MVLFTVLFLLFSRLLTGIPSEILSRKTLKINYKLFWAGCIRWILTCSIINTKLVLFSVLKNMRTLNKNQFLLPRNDYSRVPTIILSSHKTFCSHLKILLIKMERSVICKLQGFLALDERQLQVICQTILVLRLTIQFKTAKSIFFHFPPKLVCIAYRRSHTYLPA